MIKTVREIEEEITATRKTLNNYRKAYREKKIDKEVFRYQSIDCGATINALQWVLGNNNRYD